MRSTFILLAATLLSSPSWAMYKCVANGKTSFQEQPCKGAQVQTSIRQRYTPPALDASAAGSPSKARTPQEAAAAMERDRLANDAAYKLRDRNNDLVNHRTRCDAEIRAIAENRFGWNNNLAGATRSQAEATAASARATTCDTQARQIEADVKALRQQCEALGCKPPV